MRSGTAGAAEVAREDLPLTLAKTTPPPAEPDAPGVIITAGRELKLLDARDPSFTKVRHADESFSAEGWAIATGVGTTFRNGARGHGGGTHDTELRRSVTLRATPGGKQLATVRVGGKDAALVFVALVGKPRGASFDCVADCQSPTPRIRVSSCTSAQVTVGTQPPRR